MSKTALVLGGTGPTGPFVVNGLLERGYDVTIAHSGFHEAEFSGPVRHLHGDVHFKESLEQLIGSETFDLVVAQYGRLRVTADVFSDRTERLVAVGTSVGSSAESDNPRWGELGMPLSVSESSNIFEEDIHTNKFRYRIGEAEQKLFEMHDSAGYSATYIGYPYLYGPGQIAPLEWCVVRRILDGREHFILPDGGIKAEARGYVENAARAVLLAVDKPELSSGQKYFFADEDTYTLRQRVEFIARYMNHEWELVDVPYDIATPSHVLCRRIRGNVVRDLHKIHDQLGYRDAVAQAEALKRTVDWLVEHPLSMEEEQQLGDPFDYAREDQIIAAWKRLHANFPTVDYPLRTGAHIYRHPRQPMEQWTHPEDR